MTRMTNDPRLSNPTSGDRRVLQCMDIWNGNESIENELAAPGAEIFVYSSPYRGASRGGDVYYVSLCAGGVITRLILADVAGHGEAVAKTSHALRSLMRRHINAHSQSRLVRDLNQEFTRLTDSGAFATAIVAAYLNHERQMLLCNAGHPRPLWYQQRQGSWTYLDDANSSSAASTNFPLGIEESTQYRHFKLEVNDGDLLVFYTDAFIEAQNADSQFLGESGLIKIASELPCDNARRFGNGIVAGLKQYCGDKELADDATLIVVRFNSHFDRRPSIGEKLVAYGRLMHLISS